VSFLKLEPEAQRLRRAAKARAAGELAHDEYRHMRHQIIDELHVAFAEKSAGDAGPFDRYGLGNAPANSTANDTSPEAHAAARSGAAEDAKPRRNIKPPVRRSRLLLAVLLLVALGLLLFAESALGLTIPPVSERDPDPKKSPVLAVTGIQLGDAAQQLLLTGTDPQEQLEIWFAEEQAKTTTDVAGGFTAAELADLGGLLHRLGAHSEQGLDEAAVVAMNKLFRQQRQHRGLKLAQVENIAARLQAWYRQRGFLAARAFVPAQDVVGDTVVIEVLAGRLDSIQIATSTPLGELARQALTPVIGDVVDRRRVERVLYAMNRLPGVRAAGTLRAGKDIGATSLDLALDHPSRVLPFVSVDNFGDGRSSRYRVRAGADWNNPLGRGDRLRIEAVQRFDPHSAHRLAATYESPLGRLGDSISGGFETGEFVVTTRATQSGDALAGELAAWQFGLRRLLLGQRTRSLEVALVGAHQRLELAENTQRLWLAGPGLEGHWVFDDSRWILRGRAHLLAGKLTRGRYLGQPETFVQGGGEFSAWHPIGNQALRVSLRLQAGSRDLPDTQKLLLGGKDGVSSLPPRSFIADSLVQVGAELSVAPERWRRFGDFRLFSTAAQGTRVLSGDKESAFAWDAGLAWRLARTGPWSGGVRIGMPLTTDGLEDTHNAARILFDIAWQR